MKASIRVVLRVDADVIWLRMQLLFSVDVMSDEIAEIRECRNKVITEE